ncbi:cobalamin biosynthesis protein CobW [Devosia neptuniae]|jgi:cobalamin biosynthesis protein CobW|uniref:cobalamin biosynthesis protein CobW n=1 Tax=Devosia TaxID=46913 RepID=UPI0022AFF90F|nr:cobalamin biosynthesis protein CobW [Devosia neptuniae]MCZ4344587.1 cobalamin biosynthesis protein CobW [Devosia neptuniae]|tara:strand:- start:44813 stop:45859 length:1047 start_codon:yes stop_codon:yes gene_type:complete
MSKIPTTVITGFLGAGKTTLVRHLLAHAPKGKRIALIINEFGDLGVDKDILAGCGDETCREEDMVELSNGCICCTVADEFIPTMQALLARPDKFDHIIIETSGLALPQPLIRAFNWPEIKAQVTIDGIVTVADASALAEGRFASDEAAVDAQRRQDEMLDHETPLGELFEDQLSVADLVVINKADLLDAAMLDKVEANIRAELRPGVGVLRAQNGHVDITALLGLGMSSEDDIANRPSHHELEHEGEPHEHDDFDSFSIRLPAIAGKDELLAVIESTIRTHDVLRLKGFAAVPGAAARLAIQAVGPRITAYFDRPWKDGETRDTALVVIGESPLDRAVITSSLEKAAA